MVEEGLDSEFMIPARDVLRVLDRVLAAVDKCRKDGRDDRETMGGAMSYIRGLAEGLRLGSRP